MNGRPTYVIPCSGAKLGHAAPARELYTGSMFRYALGKTSQAAELTGGRVLILSARYGLVELDTVLEPYDVTLKRTGTNLGLAFDVREDLRDLDVDDVIAFLPAAYWRVLDYAVRSSTAVEGGRRCQAVDAYVGCRGIGEQRAALAAHVRQLEARQLGRCGFVESFPCGYDHDERVEAECILPARHAGPHEWKGLES